MITYLDTSALLKLVVTEQGSDRAVQVWEAADSLVSVSLITVEARTALAAAHRSAHRSATTCRGSRKNGVTMPAMSARGRTVSGTA